MRSFEARHSASSGWDGSVRKARRCAPVRNAGRSFHRGFEAALSVAPGAGFSGRAAYSFLEARFETYRRGTAVFDDNRIPGLAPHTLDILTRWAPALGFVELRGLYRGGVPTDDANTAEAPAFFVLDARAGLTPVRLGRFEVAPLAGVNSSSGSQASPSYRLE